MNIPYIAGVLDSMARFRTFTTDGGTELPRIELSTPNASLVEFLCGVTGMKPIVVRRKYDRHRCDAHCPPEHHVDKIMSVSNRWSCSGAKATIIMEAILPHVWQQKEQIEKVLKVGTDAPRKKATVDKMRQLGWPV